jgi:hypothetical protein
VIRAAAGLAMAASLAACAPREAAAPLPSHPVAAGSGISVTARPVPLDPGDPGKTRIGNFAYAGGLELTSADTSRLHGLSDLKVYGDGRLLAMGDEGDLLEARLVLDAAGRPAGLAEAQLTSPLGEDDQPLSARGKAWSDAEGLAVLPNGDRLISLEEHDRILLYRHGAGTPTIAPSPGVTFPFNLGMEGLAEDPAVAPDAYMVGAEASGDTWICRLSAGCTKDRTVAKGAEFGLAGLQPLSGGRVAYLLRAFDPIRGVRIILRIAGPDGETLDELKLDRSVTIDNFEGVAALPGPSGAIRFYLISDDNFSSAQRTLFLAFDWTPTRGR